MTAIGAILQRRGEPVSRNALARMRDALKIYGPDRHGLAASGSAGLVWTQTLGLTPEDRLERQPLAAAEGELIAFSGRLDHRADLCRALGLAGRDVAEAADGELVRLAWERWRTRASEHLFGEYSLLVVDPVRRQLVAMRGPLRSPPLVYVETPDRLAVATMPKGLFALGDVPRALNEQRLADALVLNFEDRQATYFEGIRSLPLGHMLVADERAVRVSRFYDLRDTPRLHLRHDDDYVEAADALLDAAVRSAMRSLATPALGLSSGLDSTAIAVTALGILARGGHGDAGPLLGLVAVPEAGWDGRMVESRTAGDESGPVRKLAERYPDLDVRFLDSAGLPIDHRLSELIDAADMPLRGIGSAHWSLELDRVVRAEGRRVMLTGSSGNATLTFAGGTAVLAALFRQGRWARLVRETRARNAAAGDSRWLGFAGLRAPVLAAAPHPLFAAYSRLRPDTGWRSFSAIHPDFAAEMRVDARMRDLGWDDRRQPFADRRAQMAWMLDRGGRHESGAAILGFQTVSGVETRDPLGDRKLAEFCYAIPDDQLYKSGTDRRLVRRLMAQRLPAEILSAPRGRQSADWHLRLRRDARRFVRELERLAENRLVSRIIDLPRLRTALERLPAQTPRSRAEHPDLPLVMHGLGRALGVARFIETIDGRAD